MSKTSVRINNLYIMQPEQPGVELRGEFVSGKLETTSAPPPIGSDWPEQGGIYAGQMPAENGMPGYHLIVDPDHPAGEAEPLAWGGAGEKYEGISAIDGLANTRLLMASGNHHPAARFCTRLTLGGFTDWYLPARREGSMIAATVPHLFEEAWYWTSTQSSAGHAFSQAFSGGNQSINHRDRTRRVRAVRRFLIN